MDLESKAVPSTNDSSFSSHGSAASAWPRYLRFPGRSPAVTIDHGDHWPMIRSDRLLQHPRLLGHFQRADQNVIDLLQCDQIRFLGRDPLRVERTRRGRATVTSPPVDSTNQ